ncbi:response regulator transcription factor [Streptosporangium algeriense]|uniref:Response regulator transcription factor n=1 Tax=Streptosporangium algeriense TaxID=1682748 RepID=A0ABW3DW10_9ACTN
MHRIVPMLLAMLAATMTVNESALTRAENGDPEGDGGDPGPGGPVEADTLRLLWAASHGGQDLARELAGSGPKLGVFTRHEDLWCWDVTPDSAGEWLAGVIGSGGAVLGEARLEALQTLVGPYTATARTADPAVDVRLTPREHDVLRLLCAGLSAVAIARRLGLSPRTVTKHQERLYRKLGVCDRVNAVLLAQRLGIAPSFDGGGDRGHERGAAR